MRRLRNPVRHNAWGSPTAIPELLGEEPDGQPHAELWLGAHPSAPSLAHGDGGLVPLDALIASDRSSWLGSPNGAENSRLPFLLKVLAAAEPLSLQVHPSHDQARAGFAAEQARGVAVDSAQRSYPDDNHKPELLCALTPFRLAAGFRPAAESRSLLASLGVPELDADVAALDGLAGSEAIRRVLRRWLRLDRSAASALVAPIATAVASRLAGGTPYERELGNVAELAGRHPDDAGVMVTTLMHHLELAPGEALFAPAGALHTYLCGTGIEIMACSNNVVRAGLTPKHVDAAAVLELVDTTPGPAQLVHARREPTGEEVYDVPVSDFRLSRVRLAEVGPVTLQPGRPQILLVVGGTVDLTAGDEHLTLAKGESAVVAASDPPVQLAGDATVFRATTGNAPNGP